ncbi:MAG: SEL1-like repeat protein [Devosia sp.]
MTSSILKLLAISCLVTGIGWQGVLAQDIAKRGAIEVTSLDNLLASSLKRLTDAADAGDAAAELAVARAKFADPDPKRQREGVPYLESAASAGVIDAVVQLGGLYASGGYGVAPDPSKAKSNYETAASAGSIEAVAALGRLLLNSDFTPEGRKRGIDLLNQAVNAGQVSAANTLGQLYIEGRGVPIDVDKALYYFGIGLVAGSSSSTVNIGDLLRAGALNLSPNPAVALEFFQKAAQSGDDGAGRRIADMYLRGEAVSQDVPKGLQMLADLAATGDAQSYVVLGDIQRDGEFVTADAAKAVDYYQQAAALGNNSGTLRLASLYMSGTGGVTVDIPRALQYYNDAVEQGNSSARRALAAMYLEGKVVSPDPQKAIDLLSEASTFGDGDAAEDLAVLYAKNEPFPSNYDEVKKYLDLSLAMGNTRAVIGVATAIAEGPLARGHRDEAYALLDGAVASGVPGAAARLARLQLDGQFPAQGLSGVMTMLNTAALGGDQASAHFLLQLYRDGYGLLLKPDLKAADAFLDTMEPVFGLEGTAMERIMLAAERSENQETLEAISVEYARLSKPNAISTLDNLRRVNARAYVYLIQQRLAQLGLYSGTINGTLDTTTIRAFQAACTKANAARECAPGPLTSGTARIIGDLIWTAAS